MELAYRIVSFAVGVVNLLPALLAFAPSKISKSYGISLPDANYELLLRHRATLFAVVGGLLVFSALTRRYYGLATTVGLFSMLSFVALYAAVGPGINAELKRVMQIDVVAAVALAVAFLLYLSSGQARNSL